MKRAVINLLLCICRGCRSYFNGTAVAAVKRGHRGDEPHRAWSRSIFASRRAVCLAAVLPRQFGAAHATMLACVSQCAAVCDPYVVLRVDECERVKIARRRPKKAVVAIVDTGSLCCCCFVLEAAIYLARKKSPCPPLSTKP